MGNKNGTEKGSGEDKVSSLDKPPSRSKSVRQLRKILGPVANLESYVRPDWWRYIFNSLYLKTDGDVVDDQNLTQKEVELFEKILALSKEDKILDLACGQGRHSLELAQRGYKYVEGLDRSHYLIQRAKARARKKNLNVRFREGDARRLPYLADSFQVVMLLGNSFGYFETKEDDLRVLQEIRRALKPWGRLLIDVADGEHIKHHLQARSWEWIDKKYFVCRERSLAQDGERLITREVITHTAKGVIADQFYSERLYTQRGLEELLRDASFSEIIFHGEIITDSERNQDLGMMEKRLIVSALVKKEWSQVRRKPKEWVRAVAVVLGDPSKPAQLKPCSVFDEDDFYTIDQMKSALKELSGYEFIYLNNHDNLINHLLKLKGKIELVFNLCDEGYNNDPRKELNLPALLEILGIAYTGAGPQCLAYCYDKSLVRGIAQEMKIPAPEAFFIKPEDTTFEAPFGFPVIVKPNFGDSSFGITQRCVCHNIEQLVNAISEIRKQFGYDKPILAEEFLTGKDLTVGILGNPPEFYKVLPITEEDYSALPPELPRICGYEAKWLPSSPYCKIKSVPAQLSEEVEKFIVECCLKLFERLECRDYARFDWRLDSQGAPHLLEVNPNPGWCWDGHLAKMTKLAEISYKDMLYAIIKSAEQRLGINGKREEHDNEKILFNGNGLKE